MTPPPPTAPGERSLSYKICPLLTDRICYWEVDIHFSGREGRKNFLLEGFCTGRIFHVKERFQRVKISGEILHKGNFLEFIYEISLYVLLSLYRFNFTRLVVKGNCPE